ncbi:MAG: hypothetical protein JW729_08005 [Bacteroidales bacterium]|nr:hypothetical protein [Bacteroidales bacterium]
MEDFIYPLLIFAWVAYGIYSAAKKSKAKNLAQSLPNKPKENPIESLLETFIQGNTSYKAPVPHPYIEELEEEYEEWIEKNTAFESSELYLDIVPETRLESTVDTYSGSDNVESALNDAALADAVEMNRLYGSKEETEDEAEFEFDLRQAVISQILLDRPYK